MRTRKVIKKVVVVGDENCGKSALIRLLCDEVFNEEHEPTVFGEDTIILRKVVKREKTSLSRTASLASMELHPEHLQRQQSMPSLDSAPEPIDSLHKAVVKLMERKRQEDQKEEKKENLAQEPKGPIVKKQHSSKNKKHKIHTNTCHPTVYKPLKTRPLQKSQSVVSPLAREPHVKATTVGKDRHTTISSYKHPARTSNCTLSHKRPLNRKASLSMTGLKTSKGGNGAERMGSNSNRKMGVASLDFGSSRHGNPIPPKHHHKPLVKQNEMSLPLSETLNQVSARKEADILKCEASKDNPSILTGPAKKKSRVEEEGREEEVSAVQLETNVVEVVIDKTRKESTGEIEAEVLEVRVEFQGGKALAVQEAVDNDEFYEDIEKLYDAPDQNFGLDKTMDVKNLEDKENLILTSDQGKDDQRDSLKPISEATKKKISKELLDPENELETLEIHVTLSDTSGNEEYDRLRPLSYMDADLVLLCFAMDSKQSLKDVSEKWIQEIKHFLPVTPVILVGSKSDLKEQHAFNETSSSVQKPVVPDIDHQNFVPESSGVSTEEGEQLSWAIEAEAFIECSARTNEGSNKLKDTIFHALTRVDPKKKWRKLSKLVSLNQ